MSSRRDFRQERDFWLYHFYQPVGLPRPGKGGPLDYAKDCVPIPPPTNSRRLPGGVPCWLWRWGLNSGGYGVIAGRKAHVLSYDLSRGESAKAGLDILHSCDRPYCVQPGHLAAGTAQQNADDRTASHNEVGAPSTWAALQDMHQRVDNACWYSDLTPYDPPSGQQQAFAEILCPHTYPRGESYGCFNCGYSPCYDYRRHCFHANAKLWDCRCQDTYCACRIAGLISCDFLTQTPYSCDRCRHLVVDLEYRDGLRSTGHDLRCPLVTMSSDKPF